MGFVGDEMQQPEPLTVLTVGHSTHSYERLRELLQKAGVTAIADIRTVPYSRHLPHFNRETLKGELQQDGIAYSYLGQELGGRPAHQQFYRDGVADYERMVKTDEFKRGIERVLEGAKKYRLALLCSEHDPLDCHRCLLVGRDLARRGVVVRHILATDEIIGHSDVEEILLKISGRQGDDLFSPREERLASAYRERSRKVAYSEPISSPRTVSAAE